MGIWGFGPFNASIFLFWFLLPCMGSIQMTGSMPRSFQGAEMRWVDNNGVFLISNSSNFGFGFQPTKDGTLFLLGIKHIDSNRLVWAANRGYPVESCDYFVFDIHGNVSLLSADKVIWSPDAGGKPVSAIRLLDSGNLVMLGDDNSTVWESFRHPTDTLLSNQVFSVGMSLSSNPGVLIHSLQFKSGVLQLIVDFKPPQPYWYMARDPRTVINSSDGAIKQAVIDGNSWKFYDENKVLLLQVVFSSDATFNSTCAGNCSWVAVFYNNETRHCYQFASAGRFKVDTDSNYDTFVKVVSRKNARGHRKRKNLRMRMGIGIAIAVVVLIGVFYCGLCWCRREKNEPPMGKRSSFKSITAGVEENRHLEMLSVMPVNYSYKDLQTATNNFDVKLGRGGFGSVYKGALQDGTQIAVKRLDRIGQGKEEFNAEVNIISSIHHTHLVRLRGYSTDESHMMLVYEFMEKSSLDRWIFKKRPDENVLNWECRLGIAVGTAKGLAYLHEDCGAKIIHCDVKAGNVLLDGNFRAKVADFGLAKLMSKEQSREYMSLRGTVRYMAPEWIKEGALSVKIDVYSFGKLLLEIIAGRRNYDENQPYERVDLADFAVWKMGEERLIDVLDPALKGSADEESVCRAIKVALWCIQEDPRMRPSMSKVVQMLQGVAQVPTPPTPSLPGTSVSVGPSDYHSDTCQSAVELSNPR